MAVQSEKITFEGSLGEPLAGRLEIPDGPVRAYALFAHCFTCSKDIFAAARIAGALAERNIAVLRFDFTGLGASGGDFSNTNFTSNIDDLIRAAGYLRDNYEAPKLLIGHSLGGAAVLAAAQDVPESVGVATIGAPASAEHVAHNFGDRLRIIEEQGEAEVQLAGRPFRIRKQFLDDITSQNVDARIASMRKALIVFHSPVDQTVGIENAAQIFQAAKHPKSFVSLEQADHLLSKRADAVYVAEVLSTWATRYLGERPAENKVTPKGIEGDVIVGETRAGKFQQQVLIGPHTFMADEPASIGGMESGPTPYDLLLAGLGACTSMTMRLYADRHNIPANKVEVTLKHNKIHATDCETCETKNSKIDYIERTIKIDGDVSPEQRTKLLEIADKCPVHKTLHSEVTITSRLAK